MLGNVFILGDSYSTFNKYIPDGYDCYYYEDGPQYLRSHPEIQSDENDVSCVTHTWWYSLVREKGKLLRNCSWSGTTICNTGYNGSDCSDRSFIARLEKLLSEGFFNENRVDTFFLFGGTNDSWANSPLGDEICNNWKKEDLFSVLPAFSYLIHLIISNFPDSKIYCILNTELKVEITDFFKKVCSQNGVHVIELTDINKKSGHPTKMGMMQIKDQILSFIKAND